MVTPINFIPSPIRLRGWEGVGVGVYCDPVSKVKTKNGLNRPCARALLTKNGTLDPGALLDSGGWTCLLWETPQIGVEIPKYSNRDFWAIAFGLSC